MTLIMHSEKTGEKIKWENVNLVSLNPAYMLYPAEFDRDNIKFYVEFPFGIKHDHKIHKIIGLVNKYQFKLAAPGDIYITDEIYDGEAWEWDELETMLKRCAI